MKLIGENIRYDDCMVVALYNACIAMGSNLVYQDVLDVCLSKGWYRPGAYFECKHIDEALAYFGLKGKLVNYPTKELFKKITQDSMVYFFFRPYPFYDYIPGHAFVAVKGDKGVHLANPYHEAHGWKTMSKEIKSGVKHFVIELEKAA